MSETLSRIRELAAECGKPLGEVLNVARLSYVTGVSELDVQTLLDGGTVPEPEPEPMVRERVRFLYEHHKTEAGERRDQADIAAAIAQTTTWTKRLVEGLAKPNILVGAKLTQFYGVAPTFLTDSPADAVNRELQQVLFDLQVEADPSKALADLGVRHISGRSPQMNEPSLAELAKMVANIASDLDELKRMQNPEGER
ncbi:hypothetical protein [Streptomyces sp. CL12-4]|uniref:hypothetical protein n=1 Tax=Streptomyces sp. CL12-4 TaxID=2810306 RepID=UPI001EFB6B60|nr:hypothetical protein [Streptomyces sp. CL12-4]MCG8971855.1 hypothetical protein [Streptomyces sp. CL12-4]